jgi:stage V sporulation protein AC
MTNKEYAALVRRRAPASPTVKNTALAFLFGGGICAAAEGMRDGFAALGLPADEAGTAATTALIFLSALLTALHVYDRIAKAAGAGIIVPITGFANSVASPAIEFKTEGWVLGLGAKMFSVAGPVIVYGAAASAVYGAVYWLSRRFG